MKWYGNLHNRLHENKDFTNGKIEVGTGVTYYSYSDRRPYEVVKVEDQTHVWIRALDAIGAGEAYSNLWVLKSNEDNAVIELKQRNGVWYRVCYYNKDTMMEMAKKDNGWKTPESAYEYYKLMACLTLKQLEKLEAGVTVKQYKKFGNISFGVAEYYYDYEF